MMSSSLSVRSVAVMLTTASERVCREWRSREMERRERRAPEGGVWGCVVEEEG